MSIPTALITGISGQDGSYLAELLSDQGYRVIGTTRSAQAPKLLELHQRVKDLDIVEDDLLEQSRFESLLARVKPTEVYNLAARASSADLFADPVSVGEINGLSVVRMLEAIRVVNPRIRFLQALSSEIFGSQQSAPLSEASPLHPNNTYAAAKVFAYWVVRVFREQHGIHASSAILFNHESPRRDVHFVTRKITRAVAMIRAGRQEKLALGSLGSQRDWSFAGDFVRAMQLMVAHSKPDDYVLASGIVHSVRDFCEIAFEHVGLDYRHYVTETTEYGRVHEVGTRVGNPSKATTILRWKPRVTFRDLVEMMVDHDMKLVAEELNCAQN